MSEISKLRNITALRTDLNDEQKQRIYDFVDEYLAAAMHDFLKSQEEENKLKDRWKEIQELILDHIGVFGNRFDITAMPERMEMRLYTSHGAINICRDIGGRHLYAWLLLDNYKERFFHIIMEMERGIIGHYENLRKEEWGIK